MNLKKKPTLMDKFRAGFAGLVLAMFFTMGLMPAPAHARLAYRSLPQGRVAYNNGTLSVQQEGVNAQYEYGWRWNGPYTATALTGTAGATVISLRNTDTNVLSTYAGPMKVILMSTAGTVYYSFQTVNTVAAGLMTQTAATQTGIQALVNVVTESNSVASYQYMTLQQLAAVTPTVGGVTYYILDKDW